MKSVRSRILLAMVGIVLVSLMVVSLVSIYLNYYTASKVAEANMQETAKLAASTVYNQLRYYKNIVENLGKNSYITDPEATPEQKQSAITNESRMHPEITRGNVLNAEGVSIFSGDSFSDREYFQKSINGQVWVSEPLVSRVTGEISVIVSAPIVGPGDQITGVVYVVPKETFLNDMLSSIKVSQDAGAHILNKAGKVIAHPDIELVKQGLNNQDAEKEDPSRQRIAALERKMIAGETGFGTYEMNGIAKFLGYAPIQDTDGWSIGVNAPIDDFMTYTRTSVFTNTIMLFLFLIVAAFLSLSIANAIGTPLRVLTNSLKGIAETGSLEAGNEFIATREKCLERDDEIGAITKSVDQLLETLKNTSGVLNAIAGGDLTVDSNPRSEKDTLNVAMKTMTEHLNDMFIQINDVSGQVAGGANHIAEGSQSLAQGSTQQAAAVEQLSASISAVAQQTATNAKMAREAAGLSKNIMKNAEDGNAQMERMMEAVKEINEASSSISKVIKVIDDIAFQTNILALNAAVEAARAGQHGKGFAVVAEEVRNLAAKSADAAKDTSGLIENSIAKAELGYTIATETAESLVEIVQGIGKSADLASDIASYSDQQATAISQINEGVEQVAQVVQQNSATSQQSAAASSQLNSQSLKLQQLVECFKIKADGRRGSIRQLPSAQTPPIQYQTPELSKQIHLDDKY